MYCLSKVRQVRFLLSKVKFLIPEFFFQNLKKFCFHLIITIHILVLWSQQVKWTTWNRPSIKMPFDKPPAISQFWGQSLSSLSRFHLSPRIQIHFDQWCLLTPPLLGTGLNTSNVSAKQQEWSLLSRSLDFNCREGDRNNTEANRQHFWNCREHNRNYHKVIKQY